MAAIFYSLVTGIIWGFTAYTIVGGGDRIHIGVFVGAGVIMLLLSLLTIKNQQ